MKYSALYPILFFCVLLFSGCCTFRNYAVFSEPAPALDSAKMLQVNTIVGFMRFEATIDAAPVNHLGISASGGLRLPLSADWSANALQLSVGYFNVLDNEGVEIFGGWGFQNFHFLHDTCSVQAGGGFNSLPHTEYLISDTLFHYNYFLLRPDVWWKVGAMKIIAAVNFKGLGSGNYQFYLKKYNQYFPDTSEQDVTISQYAGPLRLLVIEPSMQFQFGRKRVRFSVEGKYSIPAAANVNLSKYFSPSPFIFTTGLQFVFH